MANAAVCISIGLAGGVLSGLMGIGGGIILIPLMIIFLKMTQHQAQGISLAVIMLSFFSMLVYYKKGYVNVGAACLIVIGFISVVLIGAHAAASVPEHILRKCFALLMMAVACKMLFFK
jgi:uncharacterized membrane protein YfcA